MLYYLLYPLQEHWGALRLFRYITFRGALAIAIALLLSLLLGPRVIEALKRMNLRQYIREEGPKAHQAKAGTPTMGGVLILLALCTAVLLCSRWESPLFWVLLLTTLAFGAIGFADDYLKMRRRRNLGLTAKQKLALQILCALASATALYLLARSGGWETTLTLPFFKNFRPDLGPFFIPFAVLVIVGSSNAVNLTDGLDGLAIGCTLIAASTYAILAYAAGNTIIAGYLGIPYVKDTGELAVFAAALVGASLGFLWFNAHPAEVFMGDVGSLALGAAIGTLALIIKEEVLLVVVGGLFVAEALSVMLQVASYRWRNKKRIFRCAPLHHHFELGGWQETKVVVRFWILAILCALMGLATLKIR
ncbi:MAG: phospho-N-acetylmuramoyl-pentapeptide-transferase [Acidobacteriota bacterium]